MGRGSISTVLIQPLLRALPDAAAQRDFLRATDLTLERVADRDGLVTPSQFCVAWAEVARLSGEPAIALRLAEAMPVGAFGVVEYLCRSAPTLGDALRQWVRYLNLLDDAVEVALVIEGDHASVRVVRESEAPAPASHELCFALLVAQARAIASVTFEPERVDFTHRGPSSSRAYEAWFHAPVRFGASHTELVMKRDLLDTVLLTADPNLASLLTRVADERRDAADSAAADGASGSALEGEVRRLVRVGLKTGGGNAADVASCLGLTTRSLQRRLKDEGTSFSEVREATRAELAAHYLGEDLSIAEISFLLGFSEPSAFFRAFKRWTGVTPLERRADLRALVTA